MNTITGRVTLKETGIGIPDLLVVIIDIDPGVRNEESFEQPPPGTIFAANPDNGILGDRIGSVLTTSDGSWSLSYDDSEFQILNAQEKRPDLQLMVLGPEDADSDKPPVVLFSSKILRVNSGRTESYLIRIKSEQLKKAEVAVPEFQIADNSPEFKIREFESKKINQKKLVEGIKTVNKQFEETENAERTVLKDTFRQAILPDRAVLESMYNFVKSTDTIKDVQTKVYTTGADVIDTKINNINPDNPVPGKGIKVNLILTDEDKQNLQQYKFSLDNKEYYNIPENIIQTILFKGENDDGINNILFSNNPISKFCIQKSVDEKCAEEHTGLHTDSHTDPPGSNGSEHNNPTGMAKEDIPFYLTKVLDGKESNGFTNHKDYKSQRPDSKSIQANVDSFALQKGPADATAFYDFHSLHIAFQHVWQQLLDETLVNLGDQIHREQENAGKKGILQSIRDRLSLNHLNGLNLVMATAEESKRSNAEEVPTDISAAFDISFLEYDALTSDNKVKLLALAKDINKYELNLPQNGNTSHGLFDWPFGNNQSGNYSVDNTALASVLREQGERIIDNIRINKPYTTNQLLKELQERLLSKYEFTVFAANRDYHSINFGILNTFRQKWEPLSYQAGKLVKTIPLSPKEERKYSVKTTQSLKVTKKQALKNNSSLQQEVNTTSRAESEIIAKAHDKSNFHMSVKLDYSKISSEFGFSKDAEKESSQAKKDFRESVIKAAQEFKEERSLEIDTEENVTSEYNESGTIVNPNDELSVTYLFYELQRRYRISEQLYRVMPVVLVAQEVPAPDQITEAWIITHDWILNRSLLDDSYRDILTYIAQKNVGDDFSIRELRKNLRQQRTLVSNLQLEFSKLKKDVENKYSAMESAVRERINEEHIKRTYRWWWWYDKDGRPDEPPDPEMAKALEQAAADEHKYAVEKAEKLALAVQREVNSLNQLTSEYNTVMREHLDRITQTRRLITHIKENIFYYMQAIWSMEPPDQRFMRLYKVKVPYFEAQRTCIIQDEPVDDVLEQFRENGKKKHVGWVHGKLLRNADGTADVSQKELVEVADLDTLLGFKGNYMIFPLKKHNALTELMAAPYIDEAFGAMDPDELSNINLGEFARYICCLHDENIAEFNRLKPVLQKWLQRLLADPLRNGDEIIVPTGSLFIEMLPSDKSLLEDFKLKHREWDVYKVQAEVRKLELENIRYASRLLNERLEDPEIEKKIVVKGTQTLVDVDN
jgi:hypothetical protein